MLPVCFPMVDGELFQAWLRSLADAVSIPFSEFSKYVLGQSWGKSCLKYGSNVDEMARTFHRTNRFFPEVFEIIGEHTDYPVMRMCMGAGMSAHVAECMLRNHDYSPKVSVINHYKVCPICEKEDRKYYHRRIIRVQHQINGVRVCWKHSCALVGETVQDSDTELAIAKFAADLFSNPPDCTLEAFGDTVTADAIAGAVSAQYLTEEEGKRLLGAVKVPKIRFADGLIRFLAWFYAGDAGKFLQVVPPKKESAGSSLFERVRGEYGVGEYRCGKCGTVFHMSDKAVEAGTVCPRCRNGLTEAEQMERILGQYGDGKYEYRNGKLIHTVCGSESRAKDMFWLHDACECKHCKNNWEQVFVGTGFDVVGVSDPNGKTTRRALRLRHRCGTVVEVPGYTKYKRVNVVSCPNCDGVKAFIKRMRGLRLGERRVGINGIGCEIVGYDGTEQVRVRFDNGLERTMAYQVFDGIGKGKLDMFPELRIGLTNTMKDGRVGRITKYEGKERVGVQFEDGTFVWTDMKRFWRGTVGIGSVM